MNDEFEGSQAPARRTDNGQPPGPMRVEIHRNGHNRLPPPDNGGNGALATSRVDFWVILDMFAHHWCWLLLGSLLGAGLLGWLGWNVIQPKFTASAQLQRFETPAEKDFLRTTPMS